MPWHTESSLVYDIQDVIDPENAYAPSLKVLESILMTLRQLIALLFVALVASIPTTDSFAGDVILQDDFNRSETDDSKEQLGNGWGTNSKARAAGNKQVDLADGAMHIYRHAVADHGVSVHHEVAFKDATIEMRFKIGTGDELGINIADMNEKSVHAGHLCVAKIRTNMVTIMDMKTGQMDLQIRTRNKAKQLTEADKTLLATKKKIVKASLTPDAWHTLKVQIHDDTMTVSIDGDKTAEFTSVGIGHKTKSRLRLAVAKNAWVYDIVITRNDD